MGRLAELIGKLKEQFEHNADPSQLLVITHLIEAELMKATAVVKPVHGTTKVSVVMPASRRTFEAVAEAEVKEPIKKETEKNGKQATASKETTGWLFDPIKEIPTLAHQEKGKELNEIMASNEYSLNDKLKQEKIEVAHLLNESPIKDLKKGIGVNDRFVFINDLFRGDESMYERSIKTINGFRMFAEAEYWIERELKVKLGWDENRTTTRHFYQLVKRRFS